MSEKRLLAFGVLSAVAILAIIGIVRAMEAPVDQMGQAVASTLRGRPADVDFIIETPWGMPRWVLIIDNAIGLLLLAVMFLGRLAVVAIALSLFSGMRLLSDYAITQLLIARDGRTRDEEWVKTGAGPDPKNFRAFNLTSRGFLLTFDAYQVGSYAEGPSEIHVPFSAFAG